MTDTREPTPLPDPPGSHPDAGTTAHMAPSGADPTTSWPPAPPSPPPPGAAPPPPDAVTGPAPVVPRTGLPFRPAVLLVALLALIGMAGVIVVFGDTGDTEGTAAPTGIGGGEPPATTPDGTPVPPVEITDPAALAPPGGVPVPPSQGGALEWRTDRDWSSVLDWYYSSFPIDGLALDPSDVGKSFDGDGRPIGEVHRIVAEGTGTPPGLSPWMEIQADPDNPTGAIVSYHTYD